ncbi:conserved hypothetical protein [Leishmania mexicana MHOM/GT/2001/U1103]|uniref:Uncharacterized protein n=1 Tax=Leishmania mexicana (strain MHOM/GT/2001/U1103) TaxID=929439 RepID=E9AWQ6_LEIMU|nr:conserved hypothetical protein [Leishmania mexicana MHOM/GT/2001/U1103]CBZ27392.1 conserved hypothetical protein [Leishmania mexicana MHOM/GT/2001/U1103]
MWKNTLIEISNRAAKKAALPGLNKLQKTVATDLSISRAYSRESTAPLFSAKSDALRDSRNDYLTHLQSSTLYSSLSTLTPAVRITDESDTLLRSAEGFPFLYAQEAFCVLIKAGEVQNALRLTTFWKYQKPKHLRVARKKVKRELLRTISTLEEVKDALTLKALIDILSAALHEQQLAHKSALQAVSLAHSNACPPFIQYKLFALLGSTATADILVCAAEAACRLDGREGISVLEKLVILDKCASVSVSTAATAHLPYQLYRLLESWAAERLLDAKLTEQVCPDLPPKLLHPSHYTTLDILALSAAEARYIQKNWVSCGLFQPSSDKMGQCSEWSCIMSRLLASSKTLQAVEAKCLLIALICGPAKPAITGDSRSLRAARGNILGLLRNLQPSVRRHAAANLLKKRHLFLALKISPFTTVCVYLQSFHSKNTVDPTLCKICTALLFRLCRAGRYADAARVIWNHLSVECSVTAAHFKKNAMAVEFAVVAVSHAMREACAKKYSRSWMGYRSLALLRAAASASHHVTVMYCVPVCVGALECGVPFAAVNEALSRIFSNDAAQKAWALNLVRLCSDAEVTPTKVRADRCGIAVNIASYLAQMCRLQGNKDGEAVLQGPSRSKQLALWTTLTEPHSNPRLNALMTAVFLDRTARDSIIECTWFPLQSQNTQVFPQKERANEMPLLDIWNWEVAAAMASNCFRDESFTAFLECLKRRKPSCIRRTSGNSDNVAALLCSELDIHYPAPVVFRGQYHSFHSSETTRAIQ